MVTVTIHQNNSGGGDYWISGEDMDKAMLAAGFRRDGGSSVVRGSNWAFDVQGTDDEDMAIDVVRRLMKRAVGYDGTERGCDCCGPPFYFDTE